MYEFERMFLPNSIIASLIVVEAVYVRVCDDRAPVRRAGTKILMRRNYPNYHVNGILRTTLRCVFIRSAAPCDSNLCTRGTAARYGACAVR